jgi:hypothetical protein
MTEPEPFPGSTEETCVPDPDAFPGYTDEQAEAIHQALIKAKMKADGDWPRIFSDITCLMDDLCKANAHPDSSMHEGKVQRRYAALKRKLEAALQAYEQLGERLEWHLDDQCFRSINEYHEKKRATLEWVVAPVNPDEKAFVVYTAEPVLPG